MNKHRCEGKLRGRFMGNCERNATVQRDGKHYYKQHDPEVVSAWRHARADARKVADEKRRQKRDAEWERADLLRDAGIRDATNDELRQLVALGSIRAVLSKQSA